MLSEGGNPLGHPLQCCASAGPLGPHWSLQMCPICGCAELPKDSRSFSKPHCIHDQQGHLLVPSCKTKNYAMLPAPANGGGLSAWCPTLVTQQHLWALQSLDSQFHGSPLHLRVADYLCVHLTFICAQHFPFLLFMQLIIRNVVVSFPRCS